MRDAGLAGACHRRGGPTTTQRDSPACARFGGSPLHGAGAEPASGTARALPGIADTTHLPAAAGVLHLAVALDVWSRKPNAERQSRANRRGDFAEAVGWSMANHLRAELVPDALEMAAGQRRPKDVTHHGDQGSQHTSLAFGQRCSEAGVRPSMGSVGNACNNAMAESFFSTLEAKLLSRRRFASQAEARMACFSCIEGRHNPVRLHSGLGCQSPMTYEANMQTAVTETQPASQQTVHRTRSIPHHKRRLLLTKT